MLTDVGGFTKTATTAAIEKNSGKRGRGSGRGGGRGGGHMAQVPERGSTETVAAGRGRQAKRKKRRKQ